MSLRDEALASSEWQTARLLLAARGLSFTPEALAGAAIEAENMMLMRALMRSWAGLT